MPPGCDRASGPGSGGPSPTESREKQPASELEPPSGPYVQGLRLIDPGEEPRAVLRYTPAIGSKQMITQRHDHGSEAWENGRRVGLDQSPNTVAVISVQPIELTEGGVRVRYEREGLWVSEESAEGWEEWAAEFERMAWTAMEQVVSPTYMPSERMFSDPTENDTPRAHEQAVLHLSMLSPVILPEEPIGVGAVWELGEPVEMASVVSRVQRRFRLRSIDGSRIIIEISQLHTGGPGPTATSTHDYAELLSRRMEVDGEVEMDLTLPGPVSGWIEGDVVTRVRAIKGETKDEVFSRTSFRHTWEPYEE